MKPGYMIQKLIIKSYTENVRGISYTYIKHSVIFYILIILSSKQIKEKILIVDIFI